MVQHRQLTVVIMGSSSPEIQPDIVKKMELGVAMLLAAQVRMVEHRQLTVVIMGTSSLEIQQPDIVKKMDLGVAMLLAA